MNNTAIEVALYNNGAPVDRHVVSDKHHVAAAIIALVHAYTLVDGDTITVRRVVLGEVLTNGEHNEL